MKVIEKVAFVAIILGGVRCLWLGSGDLAQETIATPFLLIHGAHDRANRGAGAKQSAKWASRQPTCRYEVVPDAGHTAHLDNPEHFNRILLEFLHSIGGDRSTQ
jgi:pimeloyl-ACP methyl ester carboxylesterase